MAAFHVVAERSSSSSESAVLIWLSVCRFCGRLLLFSSARLEVQQPTQSHSRPPQEQRKTARATTSVKKHNINDGGANVCTGRVKERQKKCWPEPMTLLSIVNQGPISHPKNTIPTFHISLDIMAVHARGIGETPGLWVKSCWSAPQSSQTQRLSHSIHDKTAHCRILALQRIRLFEWRLPLGMGEGGV